MADWLNADERHAWRRTAAVMTLLPAALDAQFQRDAGLTQFSYLSWPCSRSPAAVSCR